VRDAVARRSAPRGTPVRVFFFFGCAGGRSRLRERRGETEKEKKEPIDLIDRNCSPLLTEHLLRRLVEVRDGAARGELKVQPLGGLGGEGLFWKKKLREREREIGEEKSIEFWWIPSGKERQQRRRGRQKLSALSLSFSFLAPSMPRGHRGLPARRSAW
jgi:hypothetical protein